MPETIGQQLKQARLAKNLSIANVVQATRIRAHVLEALEADDFESIPSAAQTRGFLKLYAEFLELSLEDMFAKQRSRDSLDREPAESRRVSTSPVEVMIESPVPEIERNATPEPKRSKPRQRKAKPVPSIEVEQIMEPASPSEANDLEADQEPALPPEPETESGTASRLIFKAIGASLRQRRESLGLNPDEIERHTHVRKHYLESMESGHFELLPSSVQARGMLNNYARFLDMDVEILLLEFANGLQAQLAERHPRIVEPIAPKRKSLINSIVPASWRRILSLDILAGGGLLLLLVIFAIWGTGRIIRQSAASTPQPTAPSISDILLSTPLTGESTATSAASPGAETVTPEAGATLEITLPLSGEGPVQVVLVAGRSAWIKVTVDGKVEFEGRVTAGTAYSYDGNSQIEVVTGDGSAISVIYNQTNLGAMGAYGEVVDRIYTATTILIPTITFTPSPTITQTPTITPRPSATPRPSNTPRPSVTLNP